MIAISIEANSPPYPPTRFTPEITGNKMPVIYWFGAKDKDNETLVYFIQIGTTPGGSEILSWHSVGTRNNYEVKTYLGIPMLVMVESDIFAHKLVALSDRRNIANRDLFDLWYFFKNNWTVNKELVEFRAGQNYKDYLNSCVKLVESVNNTYILQGLGELIDENLKRDVKENLKKELLFFLKYFIGEK